LPPGFGKIGHFGTLDPFASGVLMIGVCGAARLNDFIHDSMPKTYLAVGKVGIETPTGDYTSEIIQRDDSLYLKNEIARLPKAFLEERLRGKFLGDYLQAPHKYSASKFMGKNLHEWAREGVEIKKEAVLRHVHSIQVVKWSFPYLSVRVTVSSGTYVRTLFSDMCNDLGTIGSLIALVRERVGGVSTQNALKMKDWPQNKDPVFMEKGLRVDGVVPFPNCQLSEKHVTSFKNGAFLKFEELSLDSHSKNYWMLDQEGGLLGLAEKADERFLKPKINFHSGDQDDL
jgi:tRNA pseudouridine55 synthase